MNILEVHNKINSLVKKNPSDSYLEIINSFIGDSDSKRYFFSQAGAGWFDWLWENGFFDCIKEKAEDQTKYSYNMPELEYLERIAKEHPDKVANFIDSFKISEENSNPEVIDRFLWILREMPAEQIKSLTKKIKDERWIYLMRRFAPSAYGFKNVIDRLKEVREFEALLDIIFVTLALNDPKDKKGERRYDLSKVFCLHHISSIKLFETISDIDTDWAQKALNILIDILGEIIRRNEKDEDKVFEYSDFYALYDENLFDVDFSREKRISIREDFENLVIAVKILIERIFQNFSEDESKLREVYKIINQLPDNRLAYKIRIFALSQKPEIFKDEIKKALFRVFHEGGRYFEVQGGAEYHEFLQKSFNVFNSEDKTSYINKIFDYFGNYQKDEDVQKWRKRDGGEIMCFIKDSLSEKEKQKVKEVFNVSVDEEKCIPEPPMSKISVGRVVPRSPEPIKDISVRDLISKLKTDYTPEKLEYKYRNDDINHPRGAEGIGEEIKNDFKERRGEYIDNISGFFDREDIDPHYLYSVLRAIEDEIREKVKFTEDQLKEIFSIFVNIYKSGEKDNFERRKEKSGSMAWLTDWIGVLRVVADIVLCIVDNKEDGINFQKRNRNDILNIIKYLLTIKESPRAEEETGEYGELFGVAINSVRGRAYQSLIAFVQNDGKKLNKDIKKVFEDTLNDPSLAVQFVVGYYLAVFYFRDKEFIRRLLPDVFPKDDPEKFNIYWARWEGYLSNMLYEKLFIELREYYEYAIKFNGEYPKRKYFKDLDESLGSHMALAYAHFDLNIGDGLFNLFWNNGNAKEQEQFVSFIGRSTLTRGQASDEWLEANKVSKEKLLKFWNWAIKNINNKEVLGGFSYWINPDKEILGDNEVIVLAKRTMKKSGGNADWEYGLMKRLKIFAEKNWEATLDVIRNYFLDANNKINENLRYPIIYREELKEALEVIYNKEDKNIKKQVKKLISDLIDAGSSNFWYLKDVLK